ncbi:MAG TPA: zinc-finger domain-containing protein [Stellaceae bacterium]|nr:zinc-finger domain-containing protein [Stellaceae bacterium]
MTPVETILVSTKRVACNGGGGPLGHPKIYLNLGDDDKALCPYCSRLYVLEKVAHKAAEPAPVVES